MQRELALWVVLTGLVAVKGAAASELQRPVAVSPGGEQISRITNRCPTFSWGAVPEARSYQLVVYEVGEDRAEARKVLSEVIPGAALAWTPALDGCLERGRPYAWSVRAAGRTGPSKWSRAALFEVVPGPSEARFLAVLAAARRYHAARRPVGQEAAVAETAAGAPRTAAGQRTRDGPAVPTVTGAPGLVAEGDSCCDGNLPSVYATRLSNSSTNNDPDVLALQLTSQTEPAANMNYIGFFDWNSHENEPRLLGEIEGDGSGGLHFTGSASISGWERVESDPAVSCGSGASCAADLYCSRTDQRVLGGGFRITQGESTAVRLIESFAGQSSSTTWWHVELKNTSAASVSFRVVAVCAEVGA
jgi:hypothetical protein